MQAKFFIYVSIAVVVACIAVLIDILEHKSKHNQRKMANLFIIDFLSSLFILILVVFSVVVAIYF